MKQCIPVTSIVNITFYLLPVSGHHSSGNLRFNVVVLFDCIIAAGWLERSRCIVSSIIFHSTWTDWQVGRLFCSFQVILHGVMASRILFELQNVLSEEFIHQLLSGSRMEFAPRPVGEIPMDEF